MNSTTFKPRNSLQIKIDAPRGLSAATHQEMLRASRMGDLTMGELLEQMWVAFARTQAPEPQPAAPNGRQRH